MRHYQGINRIDRKSPWAVGWPPRARKMKLELEPDDSASMMRQIRSIPDIHKQIVEAAVEALQAMKWHWDIESKSVVYEPDHKARLDAARFLASYGDGLPTQTTLNVNIGDKPNGGPEPAIEAKVAQSPALANRLRKALAVLTP